MVDVNFIMMAKGKRNPHLSGLMDSVPTLGRRGNTDNDITRQG